MTDFDTIREALRNATTEEDVAQVADKFREDVKALAKKDKARALIIANLKAHRIWSIRNSHG